MCLKRCVTRACCNRLLACCACNDDSAPGSNGYRGEFNLHPPSSQTQAAPVRDYRSLDASLVHWHTGMVELAGRCSSMAVVGLMSDGESGLEFEFDRQAGADKRALKSAFHWQRDGALGTYLALSLLAYFSRSVPLAALVLMLNALNLAVCLRLKGEQLPPQLAACPRNTCKSLVACACPIANRWRPVLAGANAAIRSLPDPLWYPPAGMTDALLKAVEQLPLEQFLLLPLEATPLELQQQGLCLQKLRALSDIWTGTRFCFT